MRLGYSGAISYRTARLSDSRRRWTLVLVLGAALCPAFAAAASIEGLQRVDPKLVDGLVSDIAVDASRERIAKTIRDLYALEYFEWIKVVERDGQLVWQVKERPFVVEYETRGIDKLSDEDVAKAIAIKTNAFLDPKAVRTTKEAIDRKYREKGFDETSVEIRTESAGETGEVKVIIEAREINKIRITEVRIDGNRQVTDAEILDRLQSRPPSGISFISSQGKFDRQIAEADKYRVEGVYLEQGFLKVQVEGPSITYLPSEKSVIIEFSVQEGLQYNLGRLTFKGDLFFLDSTLRRFVGLTEGEPLNRLKLEDGVRRIVEAYSDFGFAFARVVPNFEFDDENRIAHVSVDITRGPMVYVRNIEVVGNTKSRDKVVRRELTIVEGELFSGSKVRQSRERVYALGFFESVTFETEAVGDDEIDLRIRVTERPTGTASAGVGFSSIDRFVGNLRLNFGNLLGYGLRLDLQLEFGGRRQSFSVSFSDPYLADTPLSLSVDMFRTRQRFFAGTSDIQPFTQNNIGGSIALGYKLALYSRYFLTFRDEVIDFSDIQIRSSRFFTDGETRSLMHTIRRDSRNHPYDAQSGNMTQASVETAGRFMGGDHDFTKYRTISQQFVSFAKNYLTLMFRGEAGLATTRGEAVPFAERYFLGGIFSVRGYEFRSVGPSLFVSTNPSDPSAGVSRVFVGGNKQLFFNTELLFPLIPPAGIKGVFFFDAGNTWLEEDRLLETGLRLGYGTGFRWFSPIGPLRFEWGFPIDRQPEERKRVFEFSIGTFF